MREIKFRAWNENEGMVYIDDLYWFEEIGIHKINETDLVGRYFKVMQYTGLKDKAGVEVWEGDIVEFVGEDCYVDWPQIGVVFFDKTYACWSIKSDQGDYSFSELCNLDLENQINIIGNEIENQELLNNK